MLVRNKWELEGYTVYEESDVLRFEDDRGEVLGFVMPYDWDEDIKQLDDGANPIEDGWEDGIGNSLTYCGWGE